MFYYETNDTPRICVERGNGLFSWSPVEFSRSAVKVGVADSHDENNLDISECIMLEYQPKEGVPGFVVETQEDLFVPYCTQDA